jgi:hypothetical protein
MFCLFLPFLHVILLSGIKRKRKVFVIPFQCSITTEPLYPGKHSGRVMHGDVTGMRIPPYRVPNNFTPFRLTIGHIHHPQFGRETI